MTLLELVTVILVIAILVAMLLPAISGIAARMERAKCTANLRGLYVAAESYVQDNHQWPQIDPNLAANTDSDEYAKQWMAALDPYRISKENWHCPTVQKLLVGQPSTDSSGKPMERIDYMATPFDDKEVTPHLWSTGCPWSWP